MRLSEGRRGRGALALDQLHITVLHIPDTIGAKVDPELAMAEADKEKGTKRENIRKAIAFLKETDSQMKIEDIPLFFLDFALIDDFKVQIFFSAFAILSDPELSVAP
ncbi:hypothetical protein L6164_018766 [Bauhinia variegata]|uniref:Uncharacterized protein n=1 Tax=Bauhinia variegata TaxID=167791 RepID=A0ACB9NCS3_BAUVA|nr:hypothetical protein L6164_018766 [Bauhinia variegata]